MRAFLQGQRRALLTLATGTGKTVVAFQICWKLWSSKWNTKGDPMRKPRILYLADRNFLVDDPKDKIFAPFGDARYKIEGARSVFSREMYFATYQAIAKDERRPACTRNSRPTFSTWSSWTSAIAGARRKILVGARFSNTLLQPVSLA